MPVCNVTSRVQGIAAELTCRRALAEVDVLMFRLVTLMSGPNEATVTFGTKSLKFPVMVTGRVWPGCAKAGLTLAMDAGGLMVSAAELVLANRAAVSVVRLTKRCRESAARKSEKRARGT